MSEQTKKTNYDESSIQILEGLDAVRKRPGMYIGSTDIRGLHHLVWEIVDNSIDEALAGFCNEINVTIHKDNSITVQDNGRGVPVGKHSSGKSTPEVIFSILHAGGKFGGDGYKTSGGLHGVGSSVVNALSVKFDVVIYRDKKISEIKFEHGGKLSQKLTTVGTTTKTGTTVHFVPDPEIFKVIDFSFSTISERIRESAFLNSGLKITLFDERTEKQVAYLFNNGLEEFITFMNEGKKTITPIMLLKGNEKNIDVEIAIQYSTEFNENLLSFANNVKTSEGGSHVVGFRSGLTRVINDYARKEGLLKEKDKNLDSTDTREGLTAIISVKVPENLIQYEGQTKGKLGTVDAKSAVESIVTSQFGFWMTENKTSAYAIIEKALLARNAREEARKAREAARGNKKKNSERLLTGKLTPAQSKNKLDNELFLVEGDSAGGSAKLGRDRKFQAILPLRGKVINAEKSKLEDLLKNEEINVMINAIGAGVGKEFDIDDSNYGKIIIMTDADTDGAHIQTLLLTFFYRYMKDLIENNRVYIALPPLFKIFNTKTKQIDYAWDENELKAKLKTIKDKFELQRYKGLGEMNAEQLWETTMDPNTRQLIAVTIDDASLADKKVVTLMGDDAKKRKEWIDENVKFTLEDDFPTIIQQ
ncbi:DNA topoisomerase IV subunit B [Spiroplasma syrphidicola EA-1]|uniref:DNA topoisomerase 4 subunit B n=1 Tax=Spiroplasma syrphidicola EA-1 TaxID=1276229 RepID=R4U6E0_9MOLU|nr:DNA topoisomerase IV subunit B [Spiroplasma syrphidicola]AGM26148.1 DNA topoisomerase IV subunit B [Spiroplasma syrphidicola EA-1]